MSESIYTHLTNDAFVIDSDLKNNVQAKTDDSLKNENDKIVLSQMSYEKKELIDKNSNDS